MHTHIHTHTICADYNGTNRHAHDDSVDPILQLCVKLVEVVFRVYLCVCECVRVYLRRCVGVSVCACVCARMCAAGCRTCTSGFLSVLVCVYARMHVYV